MHSILMLGMPLLAALAEPLKEARAYDQGFCHAHSPIISAFRTEAGATAYCSKYLRYGTKIVYV
ncbi:hypothetical protein PFICI_01307 [Pestalotiopsis fici W106-1]|uniref:Uncharacterized protein n=1 Tax=Pestalotiopsis fici (strain W106-1 / CGMCC3.15140) TaxID=1229662 RepID=W3XNB1_PESFW|nr:uncharacterized protein PFICI_01307 [Pestalotiopsis fici W106-1]ETS87479.1 hypothetical protein PFICI_01307 [Pestalotiopsis fici W106-1]